MTPADESLWRLNQLLFCMAANGTADYRLIEQHVREVFEQEVGNNNLLKAFVETVDCVLSYGINLPDSIIAEPCANRTEAGKELPKEDRNRLARHIAAVHAIRARVQCGILTPKNPCPIQCDTQNRTASLNGEVIANGLDEEACAYLRVLVNAYPDPVPWASIRERSEYPLADNQTRLKAKLPARLSNLIRRRQKGHVFELGRVDNAWASVAVWATAAGS